MNRFTDPTLGESLARTHKVEQLMDKAVKEADKNKRAIQLLTKMDPEKLNRADIDQVLDNLDNVWKVRGRG